MTVGIDEPDHRGRTGLDRAGRDLTRNPDIVVRDVELLASGWHVLRRTTYDHRHRAGHWTTEQRETYDRGNGATILLYDVARRTVLLTRQFRYPVYVNGHADGFLVEAAAGLLDDDDPEAADPPGDGRGTGRGRRRPGARVRRLHEPRFGHRARALLRRAVQREHPHRTGGRPGNRRRGHRGRGACPSPTHWP